ncbi:hypothetical protein GQ43DRAFT_180256 [Delitschia confertaspora ATCC 74209]|uniref:Uncharacterized protein n=1 Tax=Delitschia confertaspora ATCC 74209 TaxID=1513339 RepID=A0A9P4JEN7_9PLEO|nr:hypothetical protein GQ43DRAFT_180256 [Delitschia confertaspora ATCC 74209]
MIHRHYFQKKRLGSRARGHLLCHFRVVGVRREEEERRCPTPSHSPSCVTQSPFHVFPFYITPISHPRQFVLPISLFVARLMIVADSPFFFNHANFFAMVTVCYALLNVISKMPPYPLTLVYLTMTSAREDAVLQWMQWIPPHTQRQFGSLFHFRRRSVLVTRCKTCFLWWSWSLVIPLFGYLFV